MIEKYRAKSQFGLEVLGLSNCFFLPLAIPKFRDAIPINRDAKVAWLSHKSKINTR